MMLVSIVDSQGKSILYYCRYEVLLNTVPNKTSMVKKPLFPDRDFC